MRTHIDTFMIDPLSLKFGHPSTALLTFSRMKVGIKHSEIFAVGIEYFIGFHIGMVNRNVLILSKRDAVKFIRQTEYPFYHVGKFEVRAQHL